MGGSIRVMTMADESAAIAEKDLPREGEAAYFVHLHLDTAKQGTMRPLTPDVYLYQVEGKPRPMLVIRQLPGRERGRRWFLTLPITSKGRREDGSVLSNVQPIGNCIDVDKQSYVKLEVHRLPENLLNRKDGGQLVVKPCDPMGFRNAVRIVSHKMLRMGAAESPGNGSTYSAAPLRPGIPATG
jgi:hypothetical protein